MTPKIILMRAIAAKRSLTNFAGAEPQTVSGGGAPADPPSWGPNWEPVEMTGVPPIFAASSREAPSSKAAIANSRRARAASFARWANRRTSPAVYVRTGIAWPLPAFAGRQP
jgi:hypothetical protein